MFDVGIQPFLFEWSKIKAAFLLLSSKFGYFSAFLNSTFDFFSIKKYNYILPLLMRLFFLLFWFFFFDSLPLLPVVGLKVLSIQVFSHCKQLNHGSLGSGWIIFQSAV